MTWLWIGAFFFALIILFASVAVALVVRTERRTKQGFVDLQGRMQAQIEKEKAAATAQADEITRRLARSELRVSSMGVNFDMGGER